MVIYRTFRNTDPPALVQVWNESLLGRSSVPLPGPNALERSVFSRLYFDPAGLVVAENAGQVIGFAHAGFCASADEKAISQQKGVLCALLVRPPHRRQGIGTELLRRAEAYLRERGAVQMVAGPHAPCDPFYLGLYGGSNLAGFLTSDSDAEPFLLKRGYRVVQNTLIFQRRLGSTARPFDPRFVAFKQRFELHHDAAGSLGTWWRNCVLGPIEPLEFLLLEKTRMEPAGQALLWELEGFGVRWCQAAAGLLSLQVRPDLRRQGVGKYLLVQILRHLQEQCYQVLDVQADESNEAGVRLLRGTGFEQVDCGRVYERVSRSV